MEQIIQEINQTMAQVSQGQFGELIEASAKGDVLTLKDGINTTLSTLNSVIADITTVMQAQSEGDLTQRVTVSCQGDLAELKSAINTSAQRVSEIISQVAKAAYTVAGASDEVAKGSMNLSDSVQQ